MRRLLHPFVAVLTLFLGVFCAYAVWSLHSWVVVVPFVLVWLLPVVYWVGERRTRSPLDLLLQQLAFLSMGLLSFLVLAALGKDAVRLLSGWDAGTAAVWGVAGIAVAVGVWRTARGPVVREVEVPIPNLPAALDGYRIVQISDLHVGPTIRRGYVERVTRQANQLTPDLVALTGDLVDGSVAELAEEIAPLGELTGHRLFVMGNHEYYSGAPEWAEHLRTLGMQVLLNQHVVLAKNGATLAVAGVLDPAVRMIDRSQHPDPVAALSGLLTPVDVRLLLAHNPKLAKQGAAAGFDLQLSGHTHGGQFVPWTAVTRLVHRPHVAGLSREGAMWVYVSVGTGTWGPPVRLGTVPELTLIRLVRA